MAKKPTNAALKKELKSLRSVAKFADPKFVEDIDQVLKELPDRKPAIALVKRAMEGGAKLLHYPALFALSSEK